MRSNCVIGATNYPLRPIGNGCEFISGYAFKSDDFTNVGFPIIKIKNIQNKIVTTADSQCIPHQLVTKKLEKFKVQSGDVLIAMTGQGSVGRVGRLYCNDNEQPYLNQRVGKFIANETTLNLDFLYYVISNEQYEKFLFNAGSGSGQPNLSPDTIKAIEIPFPPYSTQCKIGKILKSLDDKIALSRKTNETLEQIAQTLFKSWFVDFDPVRAKAEGRQPAGMDEATATLFPDSFEESELGVIPKGWEWKTLYDTAEYVNGTAFRETDFSCDNTGFPIIKIAELKQGLAASTRYTNTAIPQKYFIDNDNILYSWSGSPETSLDVFKWFGGKGWLNQHIFKLNFLIEKHKYFVYFLLKQIKPQLIEIAKQKQTTGLGHITIADMKRIQIQFPDKPVMDIFVERIKPLYEKESLLQKEIIRLAEIRDTLLPKLLSGEISLSVIEKELVVV